MNPSPETLMAKAQEVFLARNGARTEHRFREITIAELAIGAGEVLVITQRDRRLSLRIFIETPDGRRLPLSRAGFTMHIRALPAFAGAIARALEAQLVELPDWATGDQPGPSSDAPGGK